jgi:hypothetical protein
MPRWLARAVLSLIALGTGVSFTLGGTVSAYTATATTASSTFTASSDWSAPTADAQAVGRTTGFGTGSIKQGSTYYVYAHVIDTGSPASGVASVKANVNSITPGGTAVTLSAGSYGAGGTTYNYRSAALTAASSLTTGNYSYTITSTDNAGNAGTQSFSTTVDNTAPVASDVQSTNISGGTVGHLDQGDTLTLTYSKAIDPNSVISGWNVTAVSVAVVLVSGGNGGADDTIQVWTTGSSPVQVPFGTIDMGKGHYLKPSTAASVTYGGAGSATPSTMTCAGAGITITLGSPGGASDTSNQASAMTWTPSTSVTDTAGNAASTATATQSGGVRINF